MSNNKKNPLLNSDWSAVKKELLDSLSPTKTDIVDSILQSQRDAILNELRVVYNKAPAKPMTEEEEAEEIVRRLSAPPKPIWDNSVSIPMIRRIIPNTIATDIIGVQPMTGPVGEIFTMRVRYSDSKDDLPQE